MGSAPRGVPHAELVVCHGGSGTTFGALAAGLPLVICPLFADQSANAQVVQDAGAGVVFSGRHPVPGGVGTLEVEDCAPLRDTIESALREPGRAHAARRLANEIARVPTLEQALGRLIRE